MGFDFGAFAGGLAKGGMETYQTMQAIESQKKRDELVDLQAKEAKQAMEGREALRTAIAEQGGEKTFTPNFSGTGGTDSNDVAPTPVTLTPSQRLSNSMDRAVQMGADPMAAMQYKQAARQDISADAAQKAFDWMQASDKAVAEKGLVKAAQDYLLPHYNSNKGLMNDGMTAKVVDTKTGPVVQFSDAQGNVQNNLTQPLTLKTFAQARDLVGSSMLMSSGPEHFYKGQELGMKREELGLKSKELDAKIPLYRAQANQANAHAGVFSNMLQTARDNKEAGKAMQPYIDEFAALSEEDQAGQKGQAILMKGAVAGAQKSKDMGALVTALRKPDRSTVSAEREKSAYVEWQGATTPEQQKAVQAKYPDVPLMAPSALDKAIAARNQGKTGSAVTSEVAGRPLYNASTSELQRMAKKPRGVSTAEANDAQAELEARKNESRISALPK